MVKEKIKLEKNKMKLERNCLKIHFDTNPFSFFLIMDRFNQNVSLQYTDACIVQNF